jgi:G:T-mismatch repair DNA endonuclease (very short patch repair protein)
LFKNNIVGGPIIVFHRYHERDVTTIRPRNYEEPKACKKIIGYDANALYLWSIMQVMPTGHFVRRKSENQFWRDTTRRYERMAIEWLEWEAQQKGQHIRHHGKDKEKVIGRRRLPVDGFCKDTNTVYEFKGCYWHGHDCHLNQDKPATDEEGQKMEQRYQRTQEKMQYIQDNGYAVKQMWECDWELLKKEDPAVKAFVKDMQRPCDGQFNMTEETTILRAVMEDRMFGALEVDLVVPDHLKGKFAEMPPVFKNTDVSSDDIGDHMKTYAEERGIMNQNRKCLIGSMFGQKILIIFPLLKWYAQHGLKVTKIHQVVE